MIVRRYVPAAAAVLAMVSVTACEKPAPHITVFSSGRVINVDAGRYCFDECTEHAPPTKSIRVRRNSVIGIDVPKRVAEKSWILQVGEEVLFTAPRKESHYALNVPNLPAGALPVTIVEVGDGLQGKPTGAWQFEFRVVD
ncbi:MAG: DUF2771 family protein [Mycobacteriales bacterium]